MAKAPKNGSLRDFRVDSMSSHEGSPASSYERSRSQPAFSRRPPLPERPKPQTSIKSASFNTSQSIEEWDRSESFDQPLEDSRQSWKAWEEDLDIIEEKNQSSASMRLNAERREEKPASSKTLLPWAADLALTERRMERRGEVEYSSSFQKQEMLRQQTTEYMRVLRSEFAKSIEEFNDARQSGANAIHLYSISNTENDFMLFRNGSKLVVSGQRSGRILFAFNQFLGQVYNPQLGPNFELEARWGPFDRLFWSYQSERVQVNDIIRFFLSEFVRQSYK